VFSKRVPVDLTTNRLTVAIAERRRRGDPIIDLTETNPTRAGFDYPADLLASLADPRALRYDPAPFGLPAAREAIAADYARQGAQVPAERIVLTSSTSEAYSLLFKLLTSAGDEILVPRPSYPLFDHLSQLDLVVTRPYDLEYQGRWSIDFASVEAALTARTRAVLIVSPNNPTGSYVSRDDFDRLASICADREIAMIVDEVFADYELEPGAAQTAGRAATSVDALAFGLGGLSKSVGLPQIKLGWIAAAGPDPLVQTALTRLELICDTYLSVSTPAQLGAAELLARGARIRAQIVRRIAANDHRLMELAAAVPSCRVLNAEGGWSAVVHVPSLQPEEDLVVALLLADGVLTHPGYFFDFPRESFLVVSLLPPESVFAEGVTRVLRHFACTEAIDR